MALNDQLFAEALKSLSSPLGGTLNILQKRADTEAIAERQREEARAAMSRQTAADAAALERTKVAGELDIEAAKARADREIAAQAARDEQKIRTIAGDTVKPYKYTFEQARKIAQDRVYGRVASFDKKATEINVRYEAAEKAAQAEKDKAIDKIAEALFPKFAMGSGIQSELNTLFPKTDALEIKSEEALTAWAEKNKKQEVVASLLAARKERNRILAEKEAGSNVNVRAALQVLDDLRSSKASELRRNESEYGHFLYDTTNYALYQDAILDEKKPATTALPPPPEPRPPLNFNPPEREEGPVGAIAPSAPAVAPAVNLPLLGTAQPGSPAAKIMRFFTGGTAGGNTPPRGPFPWVLPGRETRPGAIGEWFMGTPTTVTPSPMADRYSRIRPPTNSVPAMPATNAPNPLEGWQTNPTIPLRLPPQSGLQPMLEQINRRFGQPEELAPAMVPIAENFLQQTGADSDFVNSLVSDLLSDAPSEQAKSLYGVLTQRAIQSYAQRNAPMLQPNAVPA